MSTQTFAGAGVDVAANGSGHLGGQHGPDDEEHGTAATPSALADIESELLAEVTRRTVTLAVPARPGWSVRYLAEVSSAERNAWRRAAKDDKGPGGVDTTRWACAVLASKCEALLRNGVDVPTSAEDPTARTFQSPAMKALYGAARNIDVVLAFFGGHDRDSDIETAATEVMRAAGWMGDGTEMVDPTQP